MSSGPPGRDATGAGSGRSARALDSGTTLLSMFCPKCGQALVEAEGSLKCPRGGMVLSDELRELLVGLTLTQPPPHVDPAEVLGNYTDPTWYCPTDGSPMRVRREQSPTCPTCHCVLTGLVVQQLIGGHPHSDWPPKSMRQHRWRMR